MNNDGKQILNLMFRETESICVSKSKYGLHSVPLANVLADNVSLVSPRYPEIAIERVKSDDLTLVALNPIKGWRRDHNTTAYRNFLLDFDHGTIPAQIDYIKKIAIPYSAIVSTGNRGTHVLISLDRDLPSESIYRIFTEWILKIANMADQNCKNPSRSIRIAGARRNNGNEQKLIEYRGVVKLADLISWLSKHPDAKPQKREFVEPSEVPNPYRLASWVRRQLHDGIDFKNGRNKTWFSLSCAFAKAGFSLEDSKAYLQGYFTPERDFTKREWETAVESAYKHISRNI